MTWHHRDEYKLCRSCPAKALVFDTDGYWVCGHPEAFRQADHTPEEIADIERERKVVPFDKHTDGEPLACVNRCPCGHWKRTIEGGKIPKAQKELITDAQYGVDDPPCNPR